MPGVIVVPRKHGEEEHEKSSEARKEESGNSGGGDLSGLAATTGSLVVDLTPSRSFVGVNYIRARTGATCETFERSVAAVIPCLRTQGNTTIFPSLGQRQNSF